MQPLHISMRHPHYKDSFYQDLNQKLKNLCLRTPAGYKYNIKGKLTKVFSDAMCVKTGYDLIGKQGISN